MPQQETPSSLVPRRSLLLGGGAALALPWLLAGCGDPRVDNSTSPGAQTGGATAGVGGANAITVLSILPMTSLTFTPEYVCVGEGLYKQQGLDVTFQTTHGSAPAIQALLNNQGHISRIGDIETLNAYVERSAPLLAVATSSHKAPMRLVSSSKNPVKAPGDLRGKKIGLPSAGGTSAVTLGLVATKAGLKKADYTTQVVGGFSPASYELVKSGRLDGLIVSMDLSVMLQMSNPDVVVLNPAESLESGAQVYATTKPTAEKNPDAIRKFLAATRKAMEMVRDDAPDFTKTMDAIKKSGYKVTALEKPELVKKALPLYVANWSLQGHTTDPYLTNYSDQWKKGYEEAVQAGVLKGGADISGSMTSDYLPS